MFRPLIGVWTTEGHHTMMPGVALHGRTSFEWHEGGAFVLMRTEIDEPGIPSGLAIIGSDDEAGALTMLYFDERTVSRRFEVETSDGAVRWWRTAPGFSQRYVLTMSPDGDTLRGESSLSTDDSTWARDLALSYTRTK